MKKDLRSKTCCFTGHRNITGITTRDLEKRLEEEIIKLINKGVTFFGFGASIGYDQIAASMVLRLRDKYNKIKLIAVIPCENQEKYWTAEQRKHYYYLLSKVDKMVILCKNYYDGCMLARNRHLVDESGYCICYLNKKSGGTAYTVNYALSHETKVINIAY